MRIAYDASLLGPAASGVEVCIRELIRGLGRTGSGTYVAFAAAGALGSGPEPDARLTVLHPHLPPGRRLLRIAWQHAVLPAAVRRVGADLLHAPGYVAPGRCPVPFVLTVYDTIALDHPSWCRTSNWVHYRLALPLSIRRAAHIVVPSRATRDDVIRHVPSASCRITVIPPGVRPGMARISDHGRLRAFRDRLGVPGRFVLFVGNIEPKKNVPGLIRAFAEVKRGGVSDLTLVVAGRPGWKDHGPVRAALRECGLAGEVRFPGYVSDADLPLLFSAAELLAMPSFYEGFGLPVLEAMACGCPVIASDRGALPETVGDAGILVDAGSPPSLGAAMADLLGSASSRERLCRAGLARAARYTWDAAARATDAVYRAVLAERPGHAPAERKPA